MNNLASFITSFSWLSPPPKGTARSMNVSINPGVEDQGFVVTGKQFQ
ncbi:MAG TPA: hypothetical protein VEF36_17710 [Roseiarcus sp.]|nr:hypothetical protein [Roseiarcus sp.]